MCQTGSSILNNLETWLWFVGVSSADFFVKAPFLPASVTTLQMSVAKCSDLNSAFIIIELLFGWPGPLSVHSSYKYTKTISPFLKCFFLSVSLIFCAFILMMIFFTHTDIALFFSLDFISILPPNQLPHTDPTPLKEWRNSPQLSEDLLLAKAWLTVCLYYYYFCICLGVLITLSIMSINVLCYKLH